MTAATTMEWPISRIVVGKRHRRSVGDVSSLAASIASEGLLHPVVVTPRGRLIAGERRIRACESLGWTVIPVRIVDLADVVRGELAENVEREPFLPSEIEAIRRTLEPIEKAAAEARMKAGTPAKVSLGSGRVTDKIGAFAGISGRTVEKIAAVVAAAEAEPERYGRLAEDMDRKGRVDGVYRRLSNMQHADRIRAEPPPLPGGRYHVISIDAPWPYEPIAESAAYRGVVPYPTMTLQEICALPVESLAQDDCILWCWITNFHLMEGTSTTVLDAWGFKPKMMLTWIKPHFGRGAWLRNQTEHAILAVRGNPRVTLTNQTTALFAPAGKHSEKPDEFYALVESLCPAPRYLELFARKPRPGWDVWGDEVAAACDNAPTESADSAGEVFRYVLHADVPRFTADGWESLPALDGTHHGEYSVLMRRVHNCTQSAGRKAQASQTQALARKGQ